MVAAYAPLVAHQCCANEWIVAVARSVGIGLVGYLWSKRLYNREPTTA